MARHKVGRVKRLRRIVDAIVGQHGLKVAPQLRILFVWAKAALIDHERTGF